MLIVATLSLNCVGAPGERGLRTRRVRLVNCPGLHHSDRGFQYASAEFRRLLQRHRTRPSMSPPASPYDNALMESFFATLKTECFGDQVPRNRAEAQALLFDCIETFYKPSVPPLGVG